MNTMKNTMKYVIIMQNMVIEEGLFKTPAEEEQFTEVIVVHSGREPMWKCTVPILGVTNSFDAVGTLAGRFALERFNDRVDEHDLTMLSLINHLWSH